MIKKESRTERRFTRHRRVRKAVFGTAAKPRLCVFRSQKHIYVQLIDDAKALTLVSACSLEEIKLPEAAGMETPPAEQVKEEKGKKKGAKKEAQATFRKPTFLAQAVGELAAKRALEKGIKEVVFDRGGFKFHGRIKAVAEGARRAGLRF